MGINMALDDTQLKTILVKGQEEITQASNLLDLNNCRVAYFGKKGLVTDLLKQLGALSPDEKKIAGKQINDIKQILEQALQDKKTSLERTANDAALKQTYIDITLPGRQSSVGSLHPITHTKNKICDIFSKLGFVIAEGPEIENEFYNFEALNIGPNHPARTMQDTFYFANQLLLRTHTSSVQIRYMQENAAPIKMLAPGRVYRCESDVTHTPMFHQVEGLLVDKTCTFGDLKYILNLFLSHFFEKDIPTRFRASYFPFTEPSAEVDIQCVQCQGDGCRICKQTGWLEVMGCGMVHPKVLENGGINPEEYVGYAFGMGVERFAMLSYNVDDIRLFYENDLRLLKQFSGV
jgi:phenylalanyl-tRNA synthetase alpha chain